ncbi:hypothetical protein N0V83_006491 [Neocucurbitaria cava]|uniref:Uncharacterized protein n=1 Tax=Neocucurbitaria cava TaxID=798079 RepID=A0A9W8Y561_9PLEO|nr:hypothetical protein N0V83_006491 [Neocucurbitaria cava]
MAIYGEEAAILDDVLKRYKAAFNQAEFLETLEREGQPAATIVSNDASADDGKEDSDDDSDDDSNDNSNESAEYAVLENIISKHCVILTKDWSTTTC